jgi:hypothetical protein
MLRAAAAVASRAAARERVAAAWLATGAASPSTSAAAAAAPFSSTAAVPAAGLFTLPAALDRRLSAASTGWRASGGPPSHPTHLHLRRLSAASTGWRASGGPPSHPTTLHLHHHQQRRGKKWSVERELGHTYRSVDDIIPHANIVAALEGTRAAARDPAAVAAILAAARERALLTSPDTDALPEPGPSEYVQGLSLEECATLLNLDANDEEAMAPGERERERVWRVSRGEGWGGARLVRVPDLPSPSFFTHYSNPVHPCLSLPLPPKRPPKKVFATALAIKERIYGNRVVLFAPLYLANYCVNSCRYCAFRSANKTIERTALTDDQVRAEVAALERQGHRRLLVLTGEHPRYDFDTFLHALGVIADVKTEPCGNIRRMNVEIPSLSVSDMRRLKATNHVGTYTLFQETYDRAVFKHMHVSCGCGCVARNGGGWWWLARRARRALHHSRLHSITHVSLTSLFLFPPSISLPGPSPTTTTGS